LLDWIYAIDVLGFSQREAKGENRKKMRFILHLRDLRGEEEEKKLLGAFLEERRAHEVKGLSRCLA
jgi:phage-related protein